MEYARVPIKYMLKPIAEFIDDQEKYFATQHGKDTTHKASDTEIARIEAEIAAKEKRTGLAYSISAEIGRKPKAEKKPEIPFEDIPRKPQRLGPQYNPVKFSEKVG